jgi:hypothetical protein
MTAKKTEFPNDRTAEERRKDLTDEQLKDLELAGGVEGGMPAGSAGGPGGSNPRKHSNDRAKDSPGSGQRKD